MHDGGALTWREVVDKHHCALVDELSVRIDSAVHDAVSRATELEHTKADARIERTSAEARRSQAESLNQVLRRLRRAEDNEQVLKILAEGCAPYAGQLAVFVFESNQARAIASAGLGDRGLSAEGLAFDTDEAPAIVSAIDSRDPVVALAAESEISPALARALAPGAPPAAEKENAEKENAENKLENKPKAYLFPVVCRHSVLAILAASGVVLSPPLELLCEAAGMRADALASAAVPNSASHALAGPALSGTALSDPALSGPLAGQIQAAELVQLAPGVPASETSGPRSWNDLSLEDQKLHLQAQRAARVRVAEMRLYHDSALIAGIASSNIYGALQAEIDEARNRFLQTFLSKSPTMVDYLHLEILRSLANDDDRLLGDTYPGPMV